MNREELFKLAAARYGAEPEYLWAKSPDSAVLRHRENKKWFAVIMSVRRSRIGLCACADEKGESLVDVLDVKLDPVLIGSILSEKGIFPGYHMNKEHWITVLLDGSADRKRIIELLDISFGLTH